MSDRYLEHLVSLQCNMTEISCIQIFGQRQLGIHLYQKFLRSNRNIIEFYTRLDSKNKNCLSDYIEALVVAERTSDFQS